MSGPGRKGKAREAGAKLGKVALIPHVEIRGEMKGDKQERFLPASRQRKASKRVSGGMCLKEKGEGGKKM